MHMRIQTNGQVSAADALRSGLEELMGVCDHIISTFQSRLKEGVFEYVDAHDV